MLLQALADQIDLSRARPRRLGPHPRHLLEQRFAELRKFCDDPKRVSQQILRPAHLDSQKSAVRWLPRVSSLSRSFTTRLPPALSTPPPESISPSTAPSKLGRSALPMASERARAPSSHDKAASLDEIPETGGHMSDNITENPRPCSLRE